METVNIDFRLEKMEWAMKIRIYSTLEYSIEYIIKLVDYVMSEEPEDFEAMKTLLAARHKGDRPLAMRVVTYRDLPYFVDTSANSCGYAVTTTIEETLPSIIIPDKAKWKVIHTAIYQQQLIVNHEAVLLSVGISMLLPTLEDHEMMTSFLRENDIDFYTSLEFLHLNNHESLLHIVIRKIPKEIDVDDIKADLLAQNYPVLEVYRKKNRKNKIVNDMVIVSVDNTCAGRNIFELKRVMSFNVPPVTEWRGFNLGYLHNNHLNVFVPCHP